MAHPIRRRGSRGFTMIEVLVAVLVLSIGLLGLAALQTTGLRANHSAYLRSQATILAYDMGDRLRARRDNALAGSFGEDLQEWQTSLANTLPAGEGGVSVNGGIATITVQWDDSKGVEAPQAFTMEMEL